MELLEERWQCGLGARSGQVFLKSFVSVCGNVGGHLSNFRWFPQPNLRRVLALRRRLSQQKRRVDDHALSGFQALTDFVLKHVAASDFNASPLKLVQIGGFGT